MKQSHSARQRLPQQHPLAVVSSANSLPKRQSPRQRRSRRSSNLFNRSPDSPRSTAARQSPRHVPGQRRYSVWKLAIAAFVASFLLGNLIGILFAHARQDTPLTPVEDSSVGNYPKAANGRPQLSPLPTIQETWTCEVVIVGGSLGGVAAAVQSMQSGATTCLIEAAPWLGGQISSQGVSALDASQSMWVDQNFSESWINLKQLIKQQPVQLPEWSHPDQTVEKLNSCWVGLLCFSPHAGATASHKLLQTASSKAPESKWDTSIAFKGADFDASGRTITAIYAVRRIPRDPAYVPVGRLSTELAQWYAWSSDSVFEKVAMRLQAPPGKPMIVIDATDTGELVGWADIPHRLGSESRATSGERNASEKDNPDCTQAFTYPFVLAIHNDNGQSLAELAKLQPGYSREEHRLDFSLQGFPMFTGRSFFNYRRIVSSSQGSPYESTPAPGDMTMVNWNRGNDWGVMNPPLILSAQQIDESGQRQNWLGGLSVVALKHGEEHALLFAEWLLQTQSKAETPLTFLRGGEMPMGTQSGLSMVPYFREGRRILGRRAYGQREFMVRETDLRHDIAEGRNFHPTAVAMTHYSIDIHGCRYRNGEPSWEANSAPSGEVNVRPAELPLESLIPQGIDNLLIGGKGIAVTHIANGATRIHHGEWSIGAAAGATAGWLAKQAPPSTQPIDVVPKGLMTSLQQHLTAQGLRYK